MILIDTNVVSELMRATPEASVVQWMNRQPPTFVHLSSVSMAEITYGIRILPEGRRRYDLQHRFERFVTTAFSERLLDFDRAAALDYGEIMASRRQTGRPMNVVDGQIAAVARARGCALATRNITDFEDCGLELINPWDHQQDRGAEPVGGDDPTDPDERG